MPDFKLPSRYLTLILITVMMLSLLSYLGLVQQLAQNLEFGPFVIPVAVITITLNRFIHIPFRRVQVIHAIPQSPLHGWMIPKRTLYRGQLLIAINVGGILLPLIYSVVLFIYFPVSITALLLIISIVTLSSFLLSRPIPGFGIGLPLFSAPIITALATHYFADEHLISTAYIAGTIGVMLGADVLRLNDIKKIGSSFVSIGGAGILDSIVLTGFISVILVSFI